MPGHGIGEEELSDIILPKLGLHVSRQGTRVAKSSVLTLGDEGERGRLQAEAIEDRRIDLFTKPISVDEGKNWVRVRVAVNFHP